MTGGSGRKGRRTLAPEERQLWERVARTAHPIRPSPSVHAPLDPVLRKGKPANLPDKDPPRPKAPQLPARTLRMTTAMPSPRPSVTFDLVGPEVGPVGRPEAGLDRRTADRLRKGAKEPEARIDLHGMTAERAHRACLTFLSDSMARGLRMVLVITGKGGRDSGDVMSRGRGVLRDSLPGWLRASGLGRNIVGIYEAHQKHGGGGAFYIYLKRRR